MIAGQIADDRVGFAWSKLRSWRTLDDMNPQEDDASKAAQLSSKAAHPWRQRRGCVAAGEDGKTIKSGRIAEDCAPTGMMGAPAVARDARRATRTFAQVMLGLIVAPLWLLLLVASDFSAVTVAVGLLVVLVVVR